jgi:hypothetical protein
MAPSVRVTPSVRLHAWEFGQQLLAKIHMMIDVSSHMKCYSDTQRQSDIQRQNDTQSQNDTQRQTSRRGIRAAAAGQDTHDDRCKFSHEMSEWHPASE